MALSKAEVRNAFREVAMRELSTIPPKETIDHSFSKQFYEKMVSLIAEQKRGSWRLLSRQRRRALVVAAILVLSMLLVACTPTLRNAVSDFIVSVYERFVDYEKLQGIRADGLSFSYGREQVFADCSFFLPKDAFAVITGPSGIGKSTLLKLLLGIFSPTGGSLELDCGEECLPAGRDTRGLFAYVPQGNLLFSGTLRENLLLTCPNATQEQIDEAIYISNMDAFLPQLPKGLETMLGENAHGLSEGQAQRLSIARAILGGAPILLLDEATSALDTQTEETVLQRIRQMPGKTCIAVTHRPRAIALADWQIDVKRGGISCRRIETHE